MKKLLALVLSVIMVLSIMPMAYAERATYSPEVEEYIDNYIRVNSYTMSVYETYEQRCKVKNIIEKAGENINVDPIGVAYDDLINIEAEGRIEDIIVINEICKKIIDEIEKKIADGELVLVVDIYECLELAWDLEIYYSYKDWVELSDRVENIGSDKYINAQRDFDIASDIVDEIIRNEFMYTEYYTYTQADIDAAAEMMKPYINLMRACLDGDHPYGEYISDNNATEEADGTKTATCEFCGATDTITDEGTKLPSETASFFEMLFNLIKDFFSLVLSMFK